MYSLISYTPHSTSETHFSPLQAEGFQRGLGATVLIVTESFLIVAHSCFCIPFSSWSFGEDVGAGSCGAFELFAMFGTSLPFCISRPRWWTHCSTFRRRFSGWRSWSRYRSTKRWTHFLPLLSVVQLWGEFIDEIWFMGILVASFSSWDFGLIFLDIWFRMDIYQMKALADLREHP